MSRSYVILRRVGFRSGIHSKNIPIWSSLHKCSSYNSNPRPEWKSLDIGMCGQSRSFLEKEISPCSA